MAKECAICMEGIKEEYGKLKGTIVRVKNESNKIQFLYACPNCQKKEGWILKAKIKGA